MTFALEAGMAVRRIGAGRALVWIHGLGEQSASFDQITQRLTGFTHVLVDLPGYGRSPWPSTLPAGDSLAQLADHLVTWLPPRPILLGHSMGGVLAQLVAERMPVAAVIDIDGNLSRGDCTFSAQACAFDVTQFTAHGFDTVRDSVYRAGLTDPAQRGYFVGMRMASPAVFHKNAVDLVALSETETLAPRLAALDVPVLFIAGVPNGICARSRALLDQHGVRWIGIAPSGHWPFIDQPVAFADAVSRFLADAVSTFVAEVPASR